MDRLVPPFDATSDIPDTVQYYIAKINTDIDLTIQLANIKGDFIGNIHTTYLNGRHTVYLLFIIINGVFALDRDHYLVQLERKCSINYQDHNILFVHYNNLFGITTGFYQLRTRHGLYLRHYHQCYSGFFLSRLSVCCYC